LSKKVNIPVVKPYLQEAEIKLTIFNIEPNNYILAFPMPPGFKGTNLPLAGRESPGFNFI